MSISVNMLPQWNTLQLVIKGVLAETIDKQAIRITELEAKIHNYEKLELHALRLSIKPRKIR